MDHLHFRYVAGQPHGQTLGRLFQLFDDIPAELRPPLLRDLSHRFVDLSDLPSGKDQEAAEYSALKSKLQQLVGSTPL
jgi:hypothetical protein